MAIDSSADFGGDAGAGPPRSGSLLGPRRDSWRSPLAPEDGVFAYVLAFNNNAGVHRMLHCLRGQTIRPHRTLIVDNGSSEPVSEYFERQGVLLNSDEEVLRISVNQGVGAGHNRGLTEAFASGLAHVWLLEHDTFVQSHCLESLLDYAGAEREPSRVVLQPLMARNSYEAELLERQLELPADRPPRRGQGGHGMSFNGILMDTDLARRIGPVREDLFVGLEDREYHKSLERYGARVITTAEVLAIHPNWGLGRYPEPPSPFRCYYSVRNNLWIRREENRRGLVGSAARDVLGLTRNLVDRDFELARAKARGIVDGWKGSGRESDSPRLSWPG